jgi:nucleotide-binding universal stress UspA family protein
MTQDRNETEVSSKLWDELETELAPGHAARALKVLFATDGSEEAQAASALLELMPFPPGSEFQVLTVTAGAEWTLPEWFVAGEHNWGKSVAENAAQRLAREGVRTTPHTRSGSTSYEIIQAAEELDVDLIALGSKGLTGMAGFFLGSVARNVAKHARRSVLVARHPRHDLQHVLLAVDESEHAAAAARFTAGMPLPEGSEVEVVSVLRPIQQYAMVAPEFMVQYDEAMRAAREQEREELGKHVQQIAERLTAHHKRAEPVVLEGDPADQILRRAGETEADLLIAGARGVSLIEGLLVGSVADRLLNEAKCSVLLVR